MKTTSATSTALKAFAAACLTLLLATFANCAREQDAGGGGEIVVAAAANLSEAFDEIGRRFEARTGVRVVNSFGATADLARQIENGAPFDVFAAADVRHVEELEKKGLVAGTRRVYAVGRLVLWSPPPYPDAPVIARLEDLTAPRVTRVAIARPEAAPYGRAAIESLRALKVWEAIERRVVYSQNVAQAKQFAQTGNADAAFLPRSLVREGEGSFVEVDERLHQPIEQAVGVVAASARGEQARAFVEFVTGEEGRAILKKYGYGLPE